MTTTAMKRAGQLVAHLGILHQISDVRQLLLLQLAMRERQDQVALFKRQNGAVTLGLIGTQFAAPTAELSHRAGSASAGALFAQLQAISGIAGDDVAFSAGQIAEMIVAQTRTIETSDELARLDAALLGLVGRLEAELQQPEVTGDRPAPDRTPPVETDAASDLPRDETGALPDAQAIEAPTVETVGEGESAPDDHAETETEAASSGRGSRRRSA